MAVAVALGAATVTTTRANSAASRQPPRVAERTVRPTSQPSAAYGASISEVRAM